MGLFGKNKKERLEDFDADLLIEQCKTINPIGSSPLLHQNAMVKLLAVIAEQQKEIIELMKKEKE